MFGSIGMPELVLIFIVALLVFGPKKLPELGKSLGRGLAEFKRASDDLKKTIEDEIEQGKHEADAVKKQVAEVRSTFDSDGGPGDTALRERHGGRRPAARDPPRRVAFRAPTRRSGPFERLQPARDPRPEGGFGLGLRVRVRIVRRPPTRTSCPGWGSSSTWKSSAGG